MKAGKGEDGRACGNECHHQHADDYIPKTNKARPVLMGSIERAGWEGIHAGFNLPSGVERRARRRWTINAYRLVVTESHKTVAYEQPLGIEHSAAWPNNGFPCSLWLLLLVDNVLSDYRLVFLFFPSQDERRQNTLTPIPPNKGPSFYPPSHQFSCVFLSFLFALLAPVGGNVPSLTRSHLVVVNRPPPFPPLDRYPYPLTLLPWVQVYQPPLYRPFPSWGRVSCTHT